jgi:splicing factor 3B subunit 2
VYGSAHRYVVPGAKPAAAAGGGGAQRVDIIKSQRTEKLSVAIDPSEMEASEGLSEALLKEKYAKALQGEAQDDEERKRKRKKEKEQETRKFKF